MHTPPKISVTNIRLHSSIRIRVVKEDDAFPVVKQAAKPKFSIINPAVIYKAGFAIGIAVIVIAAMGGGAYLVWQSKFSAAEPEVAGATTGIGSNTVNSEVRTPFG